MSGWQTMTLGEVIRPISTKDPRRQPDKEFSYVDVSSVSNQTCRIEGTQSLLGQNAPSRARRQIKHGDILFATIRPTLKRIAEVPPELDGEVCSTGYFVFRVKPFLEARFLFYYLMTPAFMGEMERIQTGASYPAVNDGQIKGQTISFPPLAEQKRIVAILDEAFEGIAKATANAERNLANARELFSAMLANRFANQDGWRSFKLGEEVRFIDYRGKTPPKRPDGIRLITAKNVKMGFVQATPEEFVDPDCYDDWMTRGFPKMGDVLFTTEAPLGNVAQLDTNETVVVGQRLITMQTHEELLSCEFLKWLLMSPSAQTEVWSHATGATVQGIKAKLLKLIELSAPNIEEQARICGDLQAAWEWVGALSNHYNGRIEALAKLKQSLLRKAFSGELTSATDRAA